MPIPGSARLGRAKWSNPRQKINDRFELILESVGGASLTGAIERVAPGGVIVVFGNTSGESAPFDFRNFRSAQNARETLFHYSAEPPSAFASDLRSLAERLANRQISPNEHDWFELPRVITELTSGRFRGKHVFKNTIDVRVHTILSDRQRRRCGRASALPY